jgi:hypothetical protein
MASGTRGKRAKKGISDGASRSIKRASGPLTCAAWVRLVTDNRREDRPAAQLRPGPADFTDFLRAGIPIFDVYLRFDWSGPEQYDFQRVDEKLAAYLKLGLKAVFLPRVLLTPGP